MKLSKKKSNSQLLQNSITKDGKRYDVGISKDENGYFAHTHRARTPSYKSKKDIPVSRLKFIESTR